MRDLFLSQTRCKSHHPLYEHGIPKTFGGDEPGEGPFALNEGIGGFGRTMDQAGSGGQ